MPQIIRLPFWQAPLGSRVERSLQMEKLSPSKVKWIKIGDLHGFGNLDRVDIFQIDEKLVESGIRPLGIQARNYFIQNQTMISKISGQHILFLGDIFVKNVQPHDLVDYSWMCCGYRHFPLLERKKEERAWHSGGRWMNLSFSTEDVVATMKP